MKALIGSLIMVLLAAGCMPAGPGTPTDTPSSAPTTAIPATPTPTPSNAPSPATPTASSTIQPTASPTSDETFAVPPPAALVLPDGSQHDARLGTYCYEGGCVDSPYWPAATSMTRVELPSAAQQIVVAIPSQLRASFWQAQYAARDDHFAQTIWPLGSGGDVDGDELFDEARFEPPPSGEWLLYVGVWLADGGDVSNYWYISVP